ncbi:hypothetical protein Bca4012_090659 [Brassica carinata]
MTISSKTQPPLTLPVIDFSIPNLNLETPEWNSVRDQVRRALEDYGCFEALFDGASAELRKALFEVSEEAFDLPLETKLSTKESDEIYKGYVGQVSTIPLYEGMGFDGADSPELVESMIDPQKSVYHFIKHRKIPEDGFLRCCCRAIALDLVDLPSSLIL